MLWKGVRLFGWSVGRLFLGLNNSRDSMDKGKAFGCSVGQWFPPTADSLGAFSRQLSAFLAHGAKGMAHGDQRYALCA